jgi:mRNA-degrading endonuclease RelE of RelBE toxin-antitoxin system
MMVRMTAIKLEAVPEFKKELKALSKKYKHLEADFKNFQRVLEKTPINFIPGNPRISDLGINVKTPIYKLKKFRSLDCKGKGSRSGFRIIYAHIIEEDDDKIIFIEIYHKNNQSNHDKDRILRYFEE